MSRDYKSVFVDKHCFLQILGFFNRVMGEGVRADRLFRPRRHTLSYLLRGGSLNENVFMMTHDFSCEIFD